MTVTYTAQVATCRKFGCFWKLLFRWKGSIYKLLWPNMILYFTLYMLLSFIYRFTLNEEERLIFEKFSLHCRTYSDLIPVSFVLGFYVAIVVARWWNQYLTIPWPDSLAMYVSCFVISEDDRGRLIRRTIMRYANLSFLITLSMISPSVKKRFPTLDHMVQAGFMKEEEKKIFESMDQKTLHPKYWMPLVWAGSIVTRARKEGRVKDDFAMKTLVDEISKFRTRCGELLNYDWISVPLVYTQVVTLAVYTYFLASLMGNQYLDPSKGYPNHTIDPVIPIFTFLQFFFYMGWLMVAETLVNPFGEDDDDFELNWLIDRNLQVSYVVVDEIHQDHPELLKDQHWDDVVPSELPYTEATKQFQVQPFMGSTHNVEIPEGKSSFVPLEVLPENKDVFNCSNNSGLNKKTSGGFPFLNQMKGTFKSTGAGLNYADNIYRISPNNDKHTSSHSKFASDKDSIFTFYEKKCFREDSLNSIGFLRSETGMGHRKYNLNPEINQDVIFESQADSELERELDSNSEVETQEITADADLIPSARSPYLSLNNNSNLLTNNSGSAVNSSTNSMNDSSNPIGLSTLPTNGKEDFAVNINDDGNSNIISHNVLNTACQ